ncbi:MAG: hypothetical protein V2A71_10350, partial [Candidatus Eisenbacteria bacterium]
MKTRSLSPRTLASTRIVLFSLLIVSLAVSMAFAQDDGSPAQARSRKETQKAIQEPKGEALRQQIRERIENESGLQAQERERLRLHLGECKQLGLSDETVATLFSGATPLRQQIRIQERVLALAREGLPVEPVAQKLQEGQRKGATVEALERVCARLGEYVRAAHRFMKQAQEAGATPGDAAAERKHAGDVATQMWRGLTQGDMDQIQDRTHLRLRDGSCKTEDLVGATETATRLSEIGIERKRAVRLAGDAFQYGYTVREMQQLVWVVMTAHMHGGPTDKVIDTLERGIRNQNQLSQMVQEMWQHGWMGPADQQGGHGPMDNATGSGP